MASVCNDSDGNRRIQFVAPNGSRKTIRLGKIDRKGAESVRHHVEALLGVKIAGQTIPRETAVWLEGIGDKLRERLAAVGLIEAQQRQTVNEFLAGWLEGKQKMGHKPTSIRAWGQTVTAFAGLFGDRPLASLTHADGEAFRATMQGSGLRATTIHKRLGHARQVLEDAARQGHLSANPWKNVKHRAGDPSERRAYVPVPLIERVIAQCPSPHWKLLVALARHCGLRIPSEALSLQWDHVDWQRERLTVPSPKTEHIAKGQRIVPLFKAVRPYLQTVRLEAPPGSTHIFPHEWRARAMGESGWAGANLRTVFSKIVRRAGITPWPRLWHSLRASCESDLAQVFPLATVSKWLGNTPGVAMRHYVDATDAAFEKARQWQPEGEEKSGAESGALVAQKAAQQTDARKCPDSQLMPEVINLQKLTPLLATNCLIQDKEWRECIGIEPTGKTKEKQTNTQLSGAKSGAIERLPNQDRDLKELLEVWPQMSKAIKDTILLIVRLHNKSI